MREGAVQGPSQGSDKGALSPPGPPFPNILEMNWKDPLFAFLLLPVFLSRQLDFLFPLLFALRRTNKKFSRVGARGSFFKEILKLTPLLETCVCPWGVCVKTLRQC